MGLLVNIACRSPPTSHNSHFTDAAACHSLGRSGAPCPRSQGVPRQFAAQENGHGCRRCHACPSSSAAGQSVRAVFISKLFSVLEASQWVQGQGPIGKVGVFPFLSLDREKWGKLKLLGPHLLLSCFCCPSRSAPRVDMEATRQPMAGAEFSAHLTVWSSHLRRDSRKRGNTDPCDPSKPSLW